MSPELQILADTIEERIDAAREEIASLESARAALVEAGLAPARPSSRRAVAPSDRNGTPPRRRRDGAGQRRRATRTVSRQEIVALLAGSADGLSATALAERTDAPVARLTERLRELQQAGTVRSAGERRTRRWHVVTDEERIAERVAELEQARSAAAPEPTRSHAPEPS